MKKRIKPTLAKANIYMYEGGGIFSWGIYAWQGYGCDGYWAACNQPGNECSSIMNPTCFQLP